jgi:hypothetical protein
MTAVAEETYAWPGWPLEANPYGAEFDLAARKRMVAGGRALSPFLDQYRSRLGRVILEVGPFFTPLVVPDEFTESIVVYWDNDPHVLKWLAERHDAGRALPMRCSFGDIENPAVACTLRRHLAGAGVHSPGVDSAIMSQVLNYVDFRWFLTAIHGYVKPGGHIFVNNVVDYGLPPHFSERRPRSIQHTLQVIGETGYTVVEHATLDTPDARYQKNERLIVVATRP